MTTSNSSGCERGVVSVAGDLQIFETPDVGCSFFTLVNLGAATAAASSSSDGGAVDEASALSATLDAVSDAAAGGDRRSSRRTRGARKCGTAKMSAGSNR